MIRPATSADRAPLLALLDAIGLFPPKELAEVGAILEAWLDAPDPDRTWLVDLDGDVPVGVAYVVPEVQTDGTWNLLLLATHPRLRGGGRGAALVRAVEAELRRRGGRLLLVETSGTDGFARTRAFYAAQGFEEEARIRDFYTAGDDKVVFRKPLGA